MSDDQHRDGTQDTEVEPDPGYDPSDPDDEETD